MAIAVISGLISSTLLTLIVIPVLYSMVDGLQERLAGRTAPVDAPSTEGERTGRDLGYEPEGVTS
jgi:HAE1 family hydrophobic/amphiphilic exporter-1